MTKEELNTLAARFEYMLYLEAGLKEWAINNEAEKTKVESIKRAIDKYLKYLAEIINTELDAEKK